MFNSLDLSNTIDNIPVLDTGCIPIDFSPVYLDLFTVYTLFTKKYQILLILFMQNIC